MSPELAADQTGRLPAVRAAQLTPEQLAAAHLLLVPTTVPADLMDSLLRDRVAGANLLLDGELRLGRHSRITGPYELSLEDAVLAGVPLPWTAAYALEAPVEREDPPLPGLDDRDGFAFAFPHGLPWREEARGLHLLVGLARRIRGAVRPAGSNELITPDPERAVNFSVHAAHWLEPTVLLGVVGRVLPMARLAVMGQDWGGPSDEVYSGEAIARETAADPLSSDELAALHAAADERDIMVLSEQPVLDRYAVVADVPRLPGDPPAGSVEVLAHLAEGPVPAVAGEPWAGGEFITFDIQWVSPDPQERERRKPSPAFIDARTRARPFVAAVARAVVEATSGLVTDEDGFRYDRYDL